MKENDTRDRTRRRLKVILLVLLAYIVAIAALAVIIDARHVRFYVTGGVVSITVTFRSVT